MYVYWTPYKIFTKIVGQLKTRMGRQFFQRYSRKYFRHNTGNNSYCLVGDISSLLGKVDIFHKIKWKKIFKKRVNIFPFLWNNFRFSWEKFPST